MKGNTRRISIISYDKVINSSKKGLVDTSVISEIDSSFDNVS